MDIQTPIARVAAIEWPTIGLLILIYLAFFSLILFHDALPLWLWLAFSAWISAWWSSLQHEILHGHPTRNRTLNSALATLPIWLWLPFEIYRQTHLTHHRDDRLTDPLDDPETRYWTREGWQQLGPFAQSIIRLQSTLLGRLTIGPLWSITSFSHSEARKVLEGDRKTQKIWAWHLLWTAMLLVFALLICGIPFWQYLLGFVYLGTSLALIRSFAEHRARDHVDQRTAIVEKSPILGLLFLNNNLHVVHHRWPGLPWYKIKGVYAAHRDEVLKSNGGLVYNGYLDVFRRYFLSRNDDLLHPTERAPLRDGTQPGNA